jgi:hypothetical protein
MTRSRTGRGHSQSPDGTCSRGHDPSGKCGCLMFARAAPTGKVRMTRSRTGSTHPESPDDSFPRGKVPFPKSECPLSVRDSQSQRDDIFIETESREPKLQRSGIIEGIMSPRRGFIQLGSGYYKYSAPKGAKTNAEGLTQGAILVPSADGDGTSHSGKTSRLLVSRQFAG